MHDVDRTQLEYPSEFSEYGETTELTSEQYEYPGESGSILGSVFSEAQAEGAFEVGEYQEYSEYQELPFSEVMEDALASELLEVGNEQQLDYFLGNVFKSVAGTIGKAIKSPVGKALGGILKQVAKQALPMVGKAVGTFFGGPVGGAIGTQVASTAGSAFGLEVEGLSPEDRDFELARRYVRFAGDAARRAAVAPPHLEPVVVAKAAVTDAAKTHAPGLLAPPRPAPPRPAPPFSAITHPRPAPPRPAPPFSAMTHPRPAPPWPAPPGISPVRHRYEGKWVRRGRHIILLGV